jgi:hypothetical protein
MPIDQGKWLLIEARFSKPDSSTLVVIKTDAITKRKKMMTEIMKLPSMFADVQVFVCRLFCCMVHCLN